MIWTAASISTELASALLVLATAVTSVGTLWIKSLLAKPKTKALTADKPALLLADATPEEIESERARRRLPAEETAALTIQGLRPDLAGLRGMLRDTQERLRETNEILEDRATIDRETASLLQDLIEVNQQVVDGIAKLERLPAESET